MTDEQECPACGGLCSCATGPSERPHHDMGTCWCGELHAAEHRLSKDLEQLRYQLKGAEEQEQALKFEIERLRGRIDEALADPLCDGWTVARIREVLEAGER